MLTSRVLLFVSAFFFGAIPASFGQEFQIVNLTQSLGLSFGSGLSLNNQNVIATLVRVGSIDEVVTVDVNGNFTNLTQGQLAWPGQPSINNLGHIVFPLGVQPPNDCAVVNCNVAYWNGNTFQNITNGSIPVYPAGVLGRALNDSGEVAIGTRYGLVLYNGVSLIPLTSGTTITDTGNQPPSINSRGQIAFVGIDLTINRNDFYLFDGSTITNLTSDPVLQIGGAAGFASINDAGYVAFAGETSGWPSNHLLFYDGTKVIDLTATLRLPDSIYGVSLNHRDELAFITADASQSQNSVALWFFDLRTGVLKQVDSAVGPPWTVQINDSGNIAYIKGENIMLATPIASVIDVSIDIKPHSETTNINPRRKNSISVAILSLNGFDSNTVDPNTVRLGKVGTETVPINISTKDFDKNGQNDLVLSFQIQDMGIECGTTSITLTGQTFQGQAIIGSTPISTVGCKQK